MDSIEERLRKADEVREKMFGENDILAQFINDPIMGEFASMANEWLFGGVWSRPALSLQQRSLMTMSVLTALDRHEELVTHMRIALRLGLTREQITEMLMHVAFYAGMPTAVSGFRAAQQVFAEQSATAG